MIKVQDWIASIPDEEKHIAYVGEGKCEQRTFLLCGEGWETYKAFSFHLDMAFDPTSITTCDTRQVVQTTFNSSESKEEAGKTVDEITKKETYTVENITCTNHNLTDISPLSKTVTDDGILLTWNILRQHTVLPGKLWATIRALDNSTQRIKKSAIMTFEVDPAICAVSAAVPPVSEYDQMIAQMDTLREQTTAAAEEAISASNDARNAVQQIEQAADTARDHADAASASAAQAQTAAQATATHVNEAARHYQLTVNEAHSAVEACTDANEFMQSAADHAASAAISAQGALTNYKNTLAAVDQCSRYTQRCENAVEDTEKSLTALKHRRVNVRDYGAVGDGVADDRKAIINAFAAAKSMLPCEVYFPAGTYGISNGITVEMAYGTGGLLVRGAGRDITTIKYLESYDPDQKGNMWYAIRIWPVGMPDNKPPTDGDYLHDISITGLTVYDTDPCAHAWHPSKGDPNKEETHGFDLQYIKRASVTDCNLLYVGDEAIDICGCHDVIVMNNHVEGCPAAGTAGGAISIGDGCKGVIVSGNTVNGSAPDETLADGTLISKNNFGIAVESLFLPVEDVTITGNVVTNIQGHGVNLGATNAGSGLTNIIISNNAIDNCRIGVDDEGVHPKQGIKICDNIISNTRTDGGDYGCAIRFNTGLVDVAVTGNTIKNIAGEYAIRAAESNSTQVYADNLIDGLDNAVYFGSGDITFRDCVIKNTGRVTRGTTGAIICTTGDMKVSDCTLKAVANSKGIVGATSVENTHIELFKDGALASGDYLIDYSTTKRLRRVIGCHLSGRMTIKTNNAIAQGVVIESSSIGNNAITISANGVVVMGCVIVTNANNAIAETSGYDCNIFANNITKRAIATTGTHTVCVNNVDLDNMTSTA